MTCCPTCGRKLPTQRAAAPTDPATMTSEQLFAYYRRTAPAEDVRFLLRTQPLTPALRADAEALLAAAPTMVRAEFYRCYWMLKDRWGTVRQDRSPWGRPALRAHAERHVTPAAAWCDETTGDLLRRWREERGAA